MTNRVVIHREDGTEQVIDLQPGESVHVTPGGPLHLVEHARAYRPGDSLVPDATRLPQGMGSEPPA